MQLGVQISYICTPDLVHPERLIKKKLIQYVRQNTSRISHVISPLSHLVLVHDPHLVTCYCIRCARDNNRQLGSSSVMHSISCNIHLPFDTIILLSVITIVFVVFKVPRPSRFWMEAQFGACTDARLRPLDASLRCRLCATRKKEKELASNLRKSHSPSCHATLTRLHPKASIQTLASIRPHHSPRGRILEEIDDVM